MLLTEVVSEVQENFKNTKETIFKGFVWFGLGFLS